MTFDVGQLRVVHLVLHQSELIVKNARYVWSDVGGAVPASASFGQVRVLRAATRLASLSVLVLNAKCTSTRSSSLANSTSTGWALSSLGFPLRRENLGG